MKNINLYFTLHVKVCEISWCLLNKQNVVHAYNETLLSLKSKEILTHNTTSVILHDAMLNEENIMQFTWSTNHSQKS